MALKISAPEDASESSLYASSRRWAWRSDDDVGSTTQQAPGSERLISGNFLMDWKAIFRRNTARHKKRRRLGGSLLLIALSASCLNLHQQSAEPKTRNGKIIWENSYRASSVACRIQGSPGRSVRFFCFLSLPEVYSDDDDDVLVNPHFQAIVSNSDLLPQRRLCHPRGFGH